jgi:plastocyanin
VTAPIDARSGLEEDRTVRSIPSRALLSSLLAPTVLVLALVAPVAAADQTVTIEGLQFQPATVTVQVGDTVTWSNEDGVPHTATADDDSFDTGSISGGSSASQTFDTAGSVPYHCEVHPTMTGTVVVEAAAGGGGGGGGGATQPPTDTQPANEDSGPVNLLVPVLLLVLLGATAVLLGGVRAIRPRPRGIGAGSDLREPGPDRL